MVVMARKLHRRGIRFVLAHVPATQMTDSMKDYCAEKFNNPNILLMTIVDMYEIKFHGDDRLIDRVPDGKNLNFRRYEF